MSFKYTKLSGYSIIGGIGNVDIARFNVQYGVNAIPVASMTIAAGQPTFGGMVPTSILKTLNRKAKMDIYLSSSSAGVVPGGGSSMHLFDGETSSVSLVSEPGMRGIQVNGVNWLTALRSSGAFASKRTQHAFWELVPPVTMLSAAGITESVLSVEGIPAKLAETVGDLYQVLNHLVKYICGGASTDYQFSNKTALDVWKRIVGDLQFAFDVEHTVEAGVTNEVTHGFLSLYEGGVIWDSLLRLAESFCFMLVPLVSKAYIASYTPMFGKPVKSLTPADYVYIGQMGTARKNIAGLVLLENSSLTASADMAQKAPMSIFVANEYNGVLDGFPLPAWLHGPVEQTRSTETYKTTEGLYGRTPVRVLMSTITSTVNNRANKQLPKLQEVGNNYAQLVLGDRLFGGNSIAIRGPLRTDIVPGTVISVAVPTDDSRSSQTLQLYGFVNSVSIDVDCERTLASTTINLTHVRHDADNEKFGSDRNALYKTTFNQKSLIDGTSGVHTIGGTAQTTL